MALKNYAVKINGISHTLQLDEAGAKAWGVDEESVKAREAEAKAAETAAAEEAKAVEEAKAAAEAKAKADAEAKAAKPANKSATPENK